MNHKKYICSICGNKVNSQKDIKEHCKTKKHQKALHNLENNKIFKRKKCIK